jgi:hypothetical protein
MLRFQAYPTPLRSPSERAISRIGFQFARPDFDLLDTDGKRHSLASCRGPDGLIVMFINSDTRFRTCWMKHKTSRGHAEPHARPIFFGYNASLGLPG